MAFLIPDNIRTNAAVPKHHRRVASLLAMGLEDSVTAWYEAPFDPSGERPHFVVLDPSSGVAVIDVLDLQPTDGLESVAGGEVLVRRDGDLVRIVDPLARAEGFADALRRAIDGHPTVGDVPVVSLVAATTVSTTEAESSGLTTVVPRGRLITSDDHGAAMGDEGDTVLGRILMRATGGAVDEPLGEVEQAVLRAAIHPDTVIAPSAEPVDGTLFSAAELDETDVVKVMDRRQERLAKSLGSGHRVIRGVAGSGKTLILVHRARTMARLFPTKRILVTCYTKALASQLRAQLAGLENVEVVNLDALMLKLVGKSDVDFRAQRDGWDKLPGAAREALTQLQSPRYRAVMVDEAQDFNTDALAFCVELLESNDPVQQDLVIVADSAQNIFRRDFRWKDAGINAQGRTRVLRINYRNTKEILRFAHDFLVADRTITVSEDGGVDDELAVIPAEAAERTGPEPTVAVVRPDQEVDAVVDQVRRWFSAETSHRSIAVLIHSRGHKRLGKPIVDRLVAAGVPTIWVTDPDRPANKDLAGSADAPVVVSTIHSAKGLEYPQVVVCGVGSAPTPSRDDLVADRKALYVGFTRAIDELAVVTTHDNAFTPDLR